MMKPIPSIEDVFNLVTQDERQKHIKPSSKSENVVFQTSAPVITAPANEISVYQGPMDNAA